MYTVYEMKEIHERALNQLETLMSIYNDEVKEYGSAKENTLLYLNDLFSQMQLATNCIEKGLAFNPFES